MASRYGKKFTILDLLNAANKYYDESYLSTYFHRSDGRYKLGFGDTLAEFIVRELRESFDGRSTRKRQVATAVFALERAKEDMQNAIDGLKGLESSKTEAA